LRTRGEWGFSRSLGRFFGFFFFISSVFRVLPFGWKLNTSVGKMAWGCGSCDHVSLSSPRVLDIPLFCGNPEDFHVPGYSLFQKGIALLHLSERGFFSFRVFPKFLGFRAHSYFYQHTVRSHQFPQGGSPTFFTGPFVRETPPLHS